MIIATVRTLNEAGHIERFCKGYSFADKILVADGGSTDGTVELARKFKQVEVREFTDRIYMPGGAFMNPESKHVNFLIDWAKAEGADWIIFDDCDCVPNAYLRRDARDILAKARLPVVHARRIHLWLKTQHFEKMGRVGSLWAWKPAEVDICGEPNKDIGLQLCGIPEKRVELEPPYCLLHDVFPDEVTVEKKLRRYESWGMPQVHPLEWQYAPPELLPEWAVE